MLHFCHKKYAQMQYLQTFISSFMLYIVIKRYIYVTKKFFSKTFLA